MTTDEPQTQREREMYRKGWADCRRSIADGISRTSVQVRLDDQDEEILLAHAKCPVGAS